MSSAAYLGIHQLSSWRYSQDFAHSSATRIDRLRSICLKTCALVIIAWLANSVLGILAAAKTPTCEAGWKSITGCRIQRASVAGSIMAVYSFLNADL